MINARDAVDAVIQALEGRQERYFEGLMSECLHLSRKLRDGAYSFDKEGKEEFEDDLVELSDKISMLRSYYLDNRGNL